MGPPTKLSASNLTNAQLLHEVRQLQKIDDQAALPHPTQLLRRIIPRYVNRPHIQVISDNLEKIRTKQIDRLLITTPPQVGKTVTAVVGASYWWLANNPTDRIIIGSYGDQLAVDRGRDVRTLIRSTGNRYNLALAHGSASVQDWRLETGGGIRSVGVGSGIAGTPGDLVILDDPHKNRQETESATYRNTVYNWYIADILSRVAPDAPVILVMTRWHLDDLAGRVIRDEGTTYEGGRWHVVRMPALCDDPEHDPLGRAYGEPLTHPKIDIEDIERMMRHWEGKRASCASAIREWFSLYMCDPKPSEGALVTYELMKSRHHHQNQPRVKRSAVAVDPSGGGRDTAGIVGGYLGADDRLYITHDRSKSMPTHEWSKEACRLAAEIDANIIIFEKNFGGDMAGRSIRTAWSALQLEETNKIKAGIMEVEPNITARDLERRVQKAELTYGHCPQIREVVARKSKTLRAEPVAQLIMEDRVRLGAYLPDLESEWCTWQGSGDSPGRIDASVYLAYALLPKVAATGNKSAAPTGTLPTTRFGTTNRIPTLPLG
jgi:hypothetical protein